MTCCPRPEESEEEGIKRNEEYRGWEENEEEREKGSKIEVRKEGIKRGGKKGSKRDKKEKDIAYTPSTIPQQWCPLSVYCNTAMVSVVRVPQL